MKFQILQGNNIDVLRTYPDNHFDSIVTDPPYGIDFLGKDWDANTGALETYQECLRVLKPGGHILAFSAARTYHHLAVTVEQAGFEIRDQIMWIYSSGFPKSQDIGKSIQRSIGVEQYEEQTLVMQGGFKNLSDSWEDKMFKKENETIKKVVVTDPVAKQWEGWGTQLKPAHEPIVMARKPLHKSNSIARNCQQWGVGALNIDATRVPYNDQKDMPGSNNVGNDGNTFGNFNPEKTDKNLSTEGGWDPNEQGRFPSNVIGEILQADYQKYFYCPKVGRSERHIGHELPAAEPLNSPDQVRNHPLWDPSIGTNAHRLKEKIKASQGVETRTEALHSIGGYWCNAQGEKLNEKEEDAKMAYIPGIGKIYAHGVSAEVEKFRKENNIKPGNVGNNHPTVKPIELMKYLIKLITPPGGHVLDPFNGSGSTGCAAVELDFEYTGIELDPAYVAIAQKRIQAWYDQTHTTTFGQLFE